MWHRLEAQYVFPQVGARMAASLREHAARGDYDNVGGAADVARRSTLPTKSSHASRSIFMPIQPQAFHGLSGSVTSER
jgi:hypothetical protein